MWIISDSWIPLAPLGAILQWRYWSWSFLSKVKYPNHLCNFVIARKGPSSICTRYSATLAWNQKFYLGGERGCKGCTIIHSLLSLMAVFVSFTGKNNFGHQTKIDQNGVKNVNCAPTFEKLPPPLQSIKISICTPCRCNLIYSIVFARNFVM